MQQGKVIMAFIYWNLDVMDIYGMLTQIAS